MSQPFLPFALPEIGEDEIAEVVDTLRSGWVTTGPKARRFEQDFAAFLGGDEYHCIAVNSATAGLHLALEAAGVGPGDGDRVVDTRLAPGAAQRRVLQPGQAGDRQVVGGFGVEAEEEAAGQAVGQQGHGRRLSQTVSRPAGADNRRP